MVGLGYSRPTPTALRARTSCPRYGDSQRPTAGQVLRATTPASPSHNILTIGRFIRSASGSHLAATFAVCAPSDQSVSDQRVSDFSTSVRASVRISCRASSQACSHSSSSSSLSSLKATYGGTIGGTAPFTCVFPRVFGDCDSQSRSGGLPSIAYRAKSKMPA